MTARLVEHLRSALVEEALVIEMRPRPHPQVPGLLIVLIGEQHAREQRERCRRILSSHVPVDVRSARDVRPRRNGDRQLDVVEGEVEGVGAHEVFSRLERAGERRSTSWQRGNRLLWRNQTGSVLVRRRPRLAPRRRSSSSSLRVGVVSGEASRGDRRDAEPSSRDDPEEKVDELDRRRGARRGRRRTRTEPVVPPAEPVAGLRRVAARRSRPAWDPLKSSCAPTPLDFAFDHIQIGDRPCRPGHPYRAARTSTGTGPDPIRRHRSRWLARRCCLTDQRAPRYREPVGLARLASRSPAALPRPRQRRVSGKPAVAPRSWTRPRALETRQSRSRAAGAICCSPISCSVTTRVATPRSRSDGRDTTGSAVPACQSDGSRRSSTPGPSISPVRRAAGPRNDVGPLL